MRKLVCLCLAIVVVLTACSSGSTSGGIGDATGRWTLQMTSRTSSFQVTASMSLTQPQPLLGPLFGAAAPSETGILARLATFIGIQPAIAQIIPPPRDIADVAGVVAVQPNECLEGGTITGTLVGEQILFTWFSTNGAVVDFAGTTKGGGIQTAPTDPVIFGLMEGLYSFSVGRDLAVETTSGSPNPNFEMSDCAGQSGNFAARLIQ